MVEDKPDEKGEESPKSEDDKPKVSDLDRADDIVLRQKIENDRREKIISREEELHARKVVGGTADAGSVKQEVPAEQKKADDAAEFFKGSALGDAIKKANE